MLPQTILFMLGCVLHTKGISQPPPECPQWCRCEPSATLCEGGAIPQLEQRITTFHLNNAEPPIPELSPAITTRLHHLVSLKFEAAGLKAIQPNTLGLMEHLEDLSLTNNSITVIYNTTFANCSSLVNLFLDHNNLQTIHEGAFATLDRLQTLSLTHNDLLLIPKPLPPHLQFLSLEHNHIQEAPQLVLQHLTSLNLCYNSMTQINPQQIILKNLRELCLGGSKLYLNDKVITQEQFPVLESLQLRGTSGHLMNILDTTLRNIQLMSNISLSTLELDLCRISSTAAFRDMTTLHTLKMTNITLLSTRMPTTEFILPLITVLDFSGSPGLARSFLSSPPTRLMADLKVLRMPWCGITHFPRSVHEQKAPNITHLDISHNPLRCTCTLSWIPDYVREGKLALEDEKHTICANPAHLKYIPLLTATLCPYVATPSPMTTQRLTVTPTEAFQTHPTTTSFPTTTNTHTSTKSSLQLLPHSSTESSGESSKANASSPDSARGLNTLELVLVIFACIAAACLTVYILIILGRYILNCYRARNFDVDNVPHSSQQQLTMHTL